ncbi:MAG: sigma-54 dependent transcriptional regulator [Bacteroidales bacterium]|nr:sigma-54 dependent transcriptional regulator [Bacteroidales bacterium]MDD4670809.1 sigma-54 dependent transcriptional regulator [Bacteroidales bacterium]
MKKEGTILVVDDNKSILSALEILLAKYFEKVILISDPNQINTLFRKNEIDVVLLDMNFWTGVNTGNEGFYWLSRIKNISSEVQVVLFTAYADVDLAVRGIKEGAADFVVKPWDNDKLIASLQNAYNLRKSHKELKYIKEIRKELYDQPKMYWGESESMKQLRETVDKVANTDANILITGENGTGKEMLAREIHNASSRSSEIMVAVDMGAVTESLFESELFGHVKGAYTDAHNDRAGKFEVANRGTLFLDEIGNLPYHLQSKLLTVIQSNRIVRVGSNIPIDIDIRLICATNCNIYQMVKNGTFREDLLYRINTIHIDIPPLRQRKEDIVPLAEIFLGVYVKKYGKSISGFDAGAQEQLKEYEWFGNIRELQHTIEKAVIMCDGHKIDTQSLFLKMGTSKPALTDNFTTIEQMERQMIEKAVSQNPNNLSSVAQQLGITRQTLYNKIKKYGI